MIRSRNFAAVSFVTMAVFFTRSASRQTLVPLLAVARLGMSPGTLGAIFSAMSALNVLLIAPAAMMADRFGRKAVIVPSGLIMLAGLLLYAQAFSLPLFIVASLVLATGGALIGPAPAAFAADIAPAESRGVAMGLYRTTGDVGFVIGPPLLGWLSDATSFGWALSTNAVLVALAALLFGLLARETVRASARSSESAAPPREQAGQPPESSSEA